LPERNLDETVKRLSPLLSHPDLHTKIEDAGSKYPGSNSNSNSIVANLDAVQNHSTGKPGDNKNPNSLGQVVGILIGSPEFQRR